MSDSSASYMFSSYINLKTFILDEFVINYVCERITYSRSVFRCDYVLCDDVVCNVSKRYFHSCQKHLQAQLVIIYAVSIESRNNVKVSALREKVTHSYILHSEMPLTYVKSKHE